MVLGLLKKKPRKSRQVIPTRPRTTPRFGGMQERELQLRLELILEDVMNRRRSLLQPARALAGFPLVEQERFIGSVERISLSSAELAYQFCHLATPKLAKLDDAVWPSWVDGLMDAYADADLDTALAYLKSFSGLQPADQSGCVTLPEIERLLNGLLHGLSGKAYKLLSADRPYTDTRSFFLPGRIDHFATREENFQLYKALMIHQWAQITYGTWDIDIAKALQRFPDTERAINLFHGLETMRLDACISRELPGLAREMGKLKSANGDIDYRWQDAGEILKRPESDVGTSLACLRQIYPLGMIPQAAIYQGQLCLNRVTGVTGKGLRKNRETGTEETRGDPGVSGLASKSNRYFDSEQLENRAARPADVVEAEISAEFNSLPAEQGELPDYDPANEYTDRSGELADAGEDAESPIKTGEPCFSYDEWDQSRRRYRRDWCLMRESTVKPVAGALVAQTQQKYRGLLKQLRRSFEAMRQESQVLRREPYGDDIDIDAAVEAWADTHAGHQGSDRLFVRRQLRERNVAVMFMIDMSASTAGWINQVEREALILLCEVLELLGDRYAIYGFSGRGNRCCRSYHIKDFDECYGDGVRNRIQGIQPQDYTRLGTAIRHLGTRLGRVEARTRLLITLSDGRPDDIDGYRGAYGIEDTRKALNEIKGLGIHPYCITIDSTARDYLPHMYGGSNFTVIDRVNKLPTRIADIYRVLTT